jgi:ABC-2 type transport system ATP-binding protein
MAKLVLLGMALCQDPPVLVLDEPTAMLDIVNRARIWKALSSAEGRAILLASHDLGEVRELCDRAYIIVGGRVIAEGSPQALSASMSMGAEVRFIPAQGDDAARLLGQRGLEFQRTGDAVFTVEFDQLDRCIEFVKELSDQCGLRYLQLEGPSFARAVVQMMERKGHDEHRQPDKY